MIFPDHCRFIGVVDKYLREDYRPSDIIYFSSQYVLVFDAPDICNVYEVKSDGEGAFLKKCREVRKVSDASETLVYDRQVDITNRSDLIRKAASLCTGRIRTVVFQGVDRHYTFVHEPSMDGITTIDVYDVCPPEPAWLAYNIKRLDDAGMFGELMLSFDYHVLDLKDYEDSTKTTIFPCRASGLNGLFLDSLDHEPDGDIRLVGCNTSRLVFEAKYPQKKFDHINICPLSSRKPVRPFILRCCQSDKTGLRDAGGVQGVVVHWGANPREIYKAVKLLSDRIKNKRC